MVFDTGLKEHEWCCSKIKKHESFVPTVEFGSFKDPKLQEQWMAKNCDFLVQGKLRTCPDDNDKNFWSRMKKEASGR